MEEKTKIIQPNVADLRVGDNFLGFLLVRSAEQRSGKGGKAYLDLNLTDRTGEINCKKWDGNVQPPQAGSVVKLQGIVQEYNGRLQLRIEQLRGLEDRDKGMVDMSALVPCAPEKPEDMLKEINDTVDRFTCRELQDITRTMLEMAGDKLDWFPGAQRIHHAERSGLLHHTIGMLRTAEHIISAYPFLEGDLLRAGVIMHDLSKITEMKSDNMGNVTDYTRDGLLLGHLVQGVANLQEAAQRVGLDKDDELVILLEHMIISHHGVAEYGSPRQPMFVEAEVLHWLDLLDARMNEMQGIEERTPAGVFSEKIFSLDRRVYHPDYDRALRRIADASQADGSSQPEDAHLLSRYTTGR